MSLRADDKHVITLTKKYTLFNLVFMETVSSTRRRRHQRSLLMYIEISSCNSEATFKKHLKTHLYKNCFYTI